jgi:hypothetical protein
MLKRYACHWLILSHHVSNFAITIYIYINSCGITIAIFSALHYITSNIFKKKIKHESLFNMFFYMKTLNINKNIYTNIH